MFILTLLALIIAIWALVYSYNIRKWMFNDMDTRRKVTELRWAKLWERLEGWHKEKHLNGR